MGHRTYFEGSVAHAKASSPAEVPSYRFAHQRHAVRLQHLARCYQVSFAHVNCSGWSEGREHARTANQAGSDALAVSTIRLHQLQQAWDGRLRELRRIGVSPSQCWGRKEYMSQSPDVSFGIVQDDGDAAAEPQRDQDVLAKADAEICHSDHQLARLHAARR
jgi:hypothetical protein